MFQYFEDKTILIVGATGYIGGQLYQALDGKCKELIGWGRPGSWQKRDLTAVDLIYYLGAQTDAALAEASPSRDLNLNVLPFLSLIVAAPQAKFVFAGAVTQVGMTAKQDLINEYFYDDPIIVYDIHKLLIEQYLKWWSLRGQGCITLRLTNVYGPGKYNTKTNRNVLNNMVWNAVETGQITVYGQRLRDFVFIEDVVNAFVLAGAHTPPLMSSTDLERGVYLIGSGISRTFEAAAYIIADVVERRVGNDVSVNVVGPPSDDPEINKREVVIDATKFRKATGWKTEVDFVQGLHQTIEWMTK